MRRTIETKTLTESGVIWKNEENKWCRKCPQCNRTIIHSHKYPTQCIYFHKKGNRCRFCAQSGANNPMYGKHHTIKSKQKISKSNGGINHPFFGKPCSENRRKNISKANKGMVITWADKIMASREKTRFKRKPYTFPDGRVEYLQGYEPWTIDYLISSSISPNEIRVKHKEKPVIDYMWGGIPKKYFPDCYLPSSNMIVETKSGWTLKVDADQIIQKISSSLDAGHDFRLIVWGDKHKLISDTFYSRSEA